MQESTDLATGQFQLLQHATAEMQLSGPNAAMSGTDPRELSGRAILAQQAGGAAQDQATGGCAAVAGHGVSMSCWMAARRVLDRRQVGAGDQSDLERDALGRHQSPCAADGSGWRTWTRSVVPWSCSRCSCSPGDPRLQQVIGIENDISDLGNGHHD